LRAAVVGGFGVGDRPGDGTEVVAVDFLHVPAESGEAGTVSALWVVSAMASRVTSLES
jgi:hypothetical protein